jgi:OOP family OmpA-OmpF porin
MGQSVTNCVQFHGLPRSGYVKSAALKQCLKECQVRKFLMAGSLALISANAAEAQDRGFFVNAGFGQSQYDLSQDDFDELALFAFESSGATVLDADSELDDEGSAWSIAGGYRFSRYFALEASYVDLGSAEYRASGPVFVPFAGVQNTVLSFDVSVEMVTASAVGVVPIGQKFDLHGNLGLFYAETTFGIGVVVGSGVQAIEVTDEVSENNEGVFAGVGAAFHFTDNVGVSLDYTLFKDATDDEDLGKGDIDALRLSLLYRF